MAKDKNIVIKNRKASFNYQFLDTYICGMSLKGTEIKSIRQLKVSLQEAYCVVDRAEVFIKGMHIAQYEQGGHYNHDPVRLRKLLLTKQEIRKIINKLKDKGLTLIPVKLFVNERGLAKLEIAVAKGKKLHDKREDIKKKDMAKELKKY